MLVGLTGGIGAGKTTVARIFHSMGVPVYDSDAGAKRLMTESAPLRQAISALLGEQSYEDDQLNRAYIASIVFSDPEKLHALNQLVHPAVRADFQQWAAESAAPYVINEAALHYESGGFKSLDYMISVTATEAVRYARVMQRDDASHAQVEARMEKQWPQSKKDNLADSVIYNDGVRALIPQVVEVHQHILHLCQLPK